MFFAAGVTVEGYVCSVFFFFFFWGGWVLFFYGCMILGVCFVLFLLIYMFFLLPRTKSRKEQVLPTHWREYQNRIVGDVNNGSFEYILRVSHHKSS